MNYQLSRVINVISRQNKFWKPTIFRTNLSKTFGIAKNTDLSYSAPGQIINFDKRFLLFGRQYSETRKLTQLEFLEVCEDTLSGICEHFEELVESEAALKSGDISYSDGVLTAKLGKEFGTYVINRQTPNQQIWLSSPTSGPKRFDYSGTEWIYKHDNTSLHNLLDKEIGAITKNNAVNFSLRISKN